MVGGAWQATNVSADAKRSKANQSARAPTTERVYASSPEEESRQSEERFRAEVEEADLRMKLRHWNFARSWKSPSPSSSPPADDAPISPWDVARPAPSPTTGSKDPLCAEPSEKKRENRTGHDASAARSSCDRVDRIAPSDPPLDRHLVGQYLDRCIAATESQLAGARDKSEKKRAVRDIERLVEKVIVTQAGLERKEVSREVIREV